MGKITKKQIMFDIDTKVAEEILGNNYRKIYEDIRKHMSGNGFLHVEGSGYTSQQPLSKIRVAQIIKDLIKEYPYLSKCVRDIRQASVFDEQSLNILFDYDGTPGKYAHIEANRENSSNKSDSLSERVSRKKAIAEQKKE